MTSTKPFRHRPKVLVLRDPASGFIHFVGALLSIAALVLLVVESSLAGKPWHIVSFSIFGAGMIGLYSASTICHWFQHPECPSKFLEKLDHIMIFILIASTYTPLCLVPLRGPWGWSIFGIIWGLAIIGSIFKLIRLELPAWVNAAVYIAMGWLFVIGIGPISETMQPGAITWLLIGGTCYTVGALFYALKWPKLIKDVFSYHEIFHLFVIGGSFSFFWVMYIYIMQFD